MLLIYKNNLGTIGWYYERAFKKLGLDVFYFDLLEAPKWLIRANSRVVIPPIKNIDISEIISNLKIKPDIVFEIDGGNRHLSGWDSLDKLDIIKIYYAIDSHLVCNFHKKIVHDFDYIFVAQKDFIPYFKKLNKNVYWLPHAADPEIHRKLSFNKIFDIGYVGQVCSKAHRERLAILDFLCKKYSVLAVKGVYYKDISKIYSLSKIGFNKSLKGDLNMRVFEIMSCGAMLITDNISNGLFDLFKNKQHLVVYNDKNELIELLDYYLSNYDEREDIALKGQAEVRNKHTYTNRARAILDIALK